MDDEDSELGTVRIYLYQFIRVVQYLTLGAVAVFALGLILEAL